MPIQYLDLDTETYYDDECSIKTLGIYGYTHHPKFECYMLSLATTDGFQWRGHPSEAPWDKMRGYEWVTRNKGFDHGVIKRLIELGIAPADILPEKWHCSGNMSVYFGLPRALGKCTSVLYGHTMQKSIRDVEIKGKRWGDMSPDLQERVLKYALDDAVWDLRVWMDYQHDWPEHERWLSEHTYMMGARGVYVDKPALERDVAFLQTVLDANVAKLPWVQRGLPVLSLKGLREECAAVGIEPPESLAKDSEECAEWEDKHGDTVPVIAHMRTWRRTNALLKKMQTMLSRIMPNGRMEYSLLYFGASTGRWSGAGGFNVQNLPRSPFYFSDDLLITEEKTPRSVDLRSKLIAAPGKILVAADLSQVEPRCLALLAGDRAFIEKVRQGYGPYEAAARSTMGWTGGKLKDENPQLYLLSKARLLALGYGAGWMKFISMAKLYVGDDAFKQIFEKAPTEEQFNNFHAYMTWADEKKIFSSALLPQFYSMPETSRWIWIQSWVQVCDFRTNNPKITGLWTDLKEALEAHLGGTLELTLPNGRKLRYFNVSKRGKEIVVCTTKGGHFSRAYMGLVAENITQATARDVFGECLRRIETAGFPVVAHIHDEAVCECDEGTDPKVIESLMSQAPAWWKSLPVAAEAKASKCYLK